MSATGVHFWNAFLNTIRMIITIVVVFSIVLTIMHIYEKGNLSNDLKFFCEFVGLKSVAVIFGILIM